MNKETKNLTAFEILRDQFRYDPNNFISFLPEGFKAKYTNETFFKAFAEELNKGETSVFAPNNEREAIIALPTGTGKTGIFALIASLMRKDQKVMIIVPTIVLNDQTSDVLRKLYPHKKVSFISSSSLEKQSAGEIKNNFDGDIIIIVEDSFRSVMDRMKEENVSIKPTLIIRDEFHIYANADGFKPAFDEFIKHCQTDDENKKGEKPIILNFSATPFPTKIKKQNDDDIPVRVGNTVHWLDKNKVPKGKLICQISLQIAVEKGELCNVQWKSVRIDLASKAVDKNKSNEENLETSLNKKVQSSWTNIVNKYLDLYKIDTEQHNKKILAVCPYIKNAVYAAEEFCRQTGKVSAVVSSDTNCIFTTDENGIVQKQNLARDEIIQKYRNSEITAIFNVRVLREGVDFPDIEAIWMMTPMNSVSDYLQFVGRGMRLDPNNPNKILQVVDLIPETFGLISPLTAPSVFGFNPEEGGLLFEEKTINEPIEDTITKNDLVTIINTGFYDSFVSLSIIYSRITSALRKEGLEAPRPAELYQLILAEADKIHEEQDWKFIICSDTPVSIGKSLVRLYKEDKDTVFGLKFNYAILLSVQEALIEKLKGERQEKQEFLKIDNTTKTTTSVLAKLTALPPKEKQETVSNKSITTIPPEDIDPLSVEVQDPTPDKEVKIPQWAKIDKNIQLFYIGKTLAWKGLFDGFIKEIEREKIFNSNWIKNNKEFLEYYFYDSLKPSVKKHLLEGQEPETNNLIVQKSIESFKTDIKNKTIDSLVEDYKTSFSIYLQRKADSPEISIIEFFQIILNHHKLKKVFNQLKEICKDYNVPEWIVLDSLIGNSYNVTKLNYIINNDVENSNYIQCLPIFALANLIGYAEQNKIAGFKDYLRSEQRKLIDKNIANNTLWKTSIPINLLSIILNSTLFSSIFEKVNNTSVEEFLVSHSRDKRNLEDGLLKIWNRAKTSENTIEEIRKLLTNSSITNKNAGLMQTIESELGEYLTNFGLKWHASGWKAESKDTFIINQFFPKRSSDDLVTETPNNSFNREWVLQKLSNCHLKKILDNLIQPTNKTILVEIQKKVFNLPYQLVLSEETKKSIWTIIKKDILNNTVLNTEIYKQVQKHNMNFENIEKEILKIVLNEENLNSYIKQLKLSKEEQNNLIKILLPKVIKALSSQNNINPLLLKKERIEKDLRNLLEQQHLNFNLENYIETVLIETVLKELQNTSQIHNNDFDQLTQEEQSYLLGRMKRGNTSNKNEKSIATSFNDKQQAELESLIKENILQSNSDFVSISLFCHLLKQYLGIQDINSLEIQQIIPDTFKKTESVFNERTNTEELILFIDKTKLEEVKKLLETTEITFTRKEALVKIQGLQGSKPIIVIEAVLNQVLKINGTKIITQAIIDKTIEFLKN